MNKFIVYIMVAIAFGGCSPIWHAKQPQLNPNAGTCPAPHWPYIVDAVLATAVVTTAALIQTDTVHVDNLEHLENTGAHQVATPLFMVGAAFTISTITGIGPVVRCHRIGEQ